MPYGPRGMPVMYPPMPLPPTAVPGPNQVSSTSDHLLSFNMSTLLLLQCLQCFDAVGWAAGRASGL